LVWPSPEPVTLELELGTARLTLPVRAAEHLPHQMAIAALTGRIEKEMASDPEAAKNYTLTREGPDADGRVVLHKVLRQPAVVLDTGTEITETTDWYWSIREGDPNSSLWRMEWLSGIKRGSWDTSTRGIVELTSTATEFHVKESIHALEGDKPVYERTWNTSIKRDLL